jgi:hypothetical protein
VTEPLTAAQVIAVLVPVVVAWVYTVVDIVRRPGVRRGGRVGWLVAVTLVPLAMVLWMLARPVALQRRVLAATLPSDDPRSLLVDLVEARDRGDVDAAAYTSGLRAVLPPTG